MSIWTHVAGNIRYDALRLPGLPHKHPAEIIGPVSTYDNWDDDSTIPSGSEGSLRYKVVENPEPNHLAAYSVCIYGDLRDYDATDEILEWLKTITEGQMIRQGIVSCEVEGKGTVTFIYEEDGWKST